MIVEHLTIDRAEVQVPELLVMAHGAAHICVFWEFDCQTRNPVPPANCLLAILSQAQAIEPLNPDVPCAAAGLNQVSGLQVLQNHLRRLRHLGVLDEGERLRLLLRTFWTLLQHLAVGDIAQRIADVLVFWNKVPFDTKSSI